MQPNPQMPGGRWRFRRHRSTKRRVWNMIVMGIGYATILYELIRGVIYLLVLAREWME